MNNPMNEQSIALCEECLTESYFKPCDNCMSTVFALPKDVIRIISPIECNELVCDDCGGEYDEDLKLTACDDCDEYSTEQLETYDDTFEDPESPRGYGEGYFHGNSLCKKCTTKHDKQTEHMYDELAIEREYREREGMMEL